MIFLRSDKCSDGLVIALHQVCGGKVVWYTCTTPLQLVPLVVCEAFRNQPRLQLRTRGCGGVHAAQAVG
ncbi:unnamed protein product [Ascophyllum nodosum]